MEFYVYYSLPAVLYQDSIQHSHHFMARCMKSEKQGHFVFYGAMVAEGVIAFNMGVPQDVPSIK